MLFEKIQLESDEKVLKIVHKHWFLIFTRSMGIALTALFPLIGWVIVSYMLSTPESPIQLDLSNYSNYFVYFFSTWLLFNWMMFMHMLTDHHLDVWVVTDRRIISIDQRGLFNRNIGSFRLEKLQDVNISINGIVATFLHYGTVEAQTASGSEEEFRSDYLPHPRELKSIILEAADMRLQHQRGNGAEQAA